MKKPFSILLSLALLANLSLAGAWAGTAPPCALCLPLPEGRTAHITRGSGGPAPLRVDIYAKNRPAAPLATVFLKAGGGPLEIGALDLHGMVRVAGDGMEIRLHHRPPPR